jgi:DNA-binding transcriptional regulator YiaG
MEPHEIRAKRQELGLSQQGLAERLRISVGTVARWEQGKAPPPPYLSLALAELTRQVKKTGPDQE